MKKLVLGIAVGLSSLSFGQMTTEGTAIQVGGCDTYQLTPDVTNVAGAAWSSDPIDLTQSFDMIFDVYLGVSGIWEADGMAFVLQENSTGLGSLGNPLGYGTPYTIPLSANNLAIELDIWDNTPSVATDIPQDHMGISSNGDNEHDLVAATQFPGAQEIADGNWHEFRVQWDAGLQVLAVYWEGNAFPMIALNNDIVTNIFAGNSSVYWGFTAGTGGIGSEFRVRAVSSPSFTTDLTTVCPGNPIQFTDGSTTPIGNIVGWEWDFGDGSPLNTTQNPSYTYMAPGNYTATLTINDGMCNASTSTSITVLDSLNLNMSATSVTCFGDTDGTSTAVTSDGTGPYTYGWNDTGSQTTSTATGLAPGTYTATVTDNLGCVGIDSIVVTEPAEILLAMDTVHVLCNGDSTGQGIVDVITNGVAPFTYAWDDFNSQTTDTASGLPAGTYNVVVTDDNGCTATESVQINENTAINASATSTPDNGTNNGSIDLTVTGGTPPYTFAWDNSDTNEDPSGLAAGDYTVTVTDDNGCTSLLTVTVNSSAGFGSLANLGFSVYPNPTTGLFTIQGEGNYQVFIRDLSGRLVLSQQSADNTTIELTNVEKGIYLISIFKDSREYTDKLIIK